MSIGNAGNETKATNIPAIERAGERSWADWLELFEAEGAAQLSLPPPEIARIALAALPEGRVPLGGGISRHHARVSDC